MMDTQKISAADKHPEFAGFLKAIVVSVNSYHNWRINGAKSTSIGTQPLQELILDGYEFLPGSVKLGLGETGNSNAGTSHGGPIGSHGADSLVVMMQENELMKKMVVKQARISTPPL